MHITLHQFAFAAVALLTIGSAIMVVTLRNIFHSLLFLALAFLGVAGVYLTLSADFMAAAQVLVYGGMALAAGRMRGWLAGSAGAQVATGRAVGALLMLTAAWTLAQGWR